VAQGLGGVWSEMIAGARRRRSADRSPLEAVGAAFAELAGGFDPIRELTFSQAHLPAFIDRNLASISIGPAPTRVPAGPGKHRL
jgi:hypothetical protein